MRVMELKPYDNCETATKNAVQMRMKWIVISIEKLHRNSIDMICCIYSQLSLIFSAKFQRNFGVLYRAVARTLIGGGGGCIFIYSGYARLTSFEINFISKETSRAEPEYMNTHSPPPQLTF